MTKTFSKVFSLALVLALIMGALPVHRVQAAGTVSLTAFGSAYTQDFNTLASSGTSSVVPTGWDFSESGTNANTTYTAGTGSGTAGDTYSFGLSPLAERAFGGLRSGTLVPLIGAQFTNNTGGTITSLDVTYTGEQWRLGQNTTGRSADRLDFQLSTNATSLTTGTWSDYDALDFSSPTVAGTVGALDGNAAANRVTLGFTISGLNIPNGASFWIRWADSDLIPGADDGLAVDDFSLTPIFTPTPTNPTGTGLANPDPVTAGSSTLLTVSVTPGTNPTSTGLAVACDLSAIGGSATQSFYDDNTNGDVTAGDNIFSFQATVTSGTSAGAKNLPCTITDAQSRTGSTSISLTVQAAQSSAPVVISQVYGGGGNTGATYKNDFIELYNRSSSPVNLTGWSVQYAAAAGTSWQVTTLTGIIQPGNYFLIQEAAGAGGTVDLPTPNASGNIAMSATAGKVALVNSATALSGTGCPFAASVVDFVGYGSTANCSETSPTATLSNTTAAIRKSGGAQDTDNNSADFDIGAPTPRNTPPPINLSINDVTLNEGNAGTTTFSFVVSLTSPAGSGGVTFDIATADGTATSPSDFTAKTLTGQTIPAGSSTYTFDVLVNGDTVNEPDETFFVNVTNVTGVSSVTDYQGLGTILNDDVDFCSVSYTPIYNIQGPSVAAAIIGNVATKGVVVGDYEYPGSGSTANFLRGFYIQDMTGDGNATTSDGIFVFNGNNNSVNLGDIVYVSGTSGEFQDQTQISLVTNITACGTGTVAPVDVTFPVPSSTYLERFEGMLVRLPQTMYVTEHFQLGRFGQVVLSSGGRLRQPTNVVAPGAPALALQAANNLNKIILDDALQNQNPDPILFGRGGLPLSASNTLRGGDTATGIVGVMTYTWAGNAASGNAYRVRPINALGGGVPNFQPANPRPASVPNVGGTVKVVGMNLLNFFNSFSACFPSNTASDCRGASNAAEFQRQYTKTVAAILTMNPDVLGVNELENDGYGPASSIQFLVDQLNAATAPGTYAFINVDANTGQVNAMGTDAIRVALLYKPGVVTPIGQTAALNTTAFINGGDSAPRNRASLAQAFQVNNTGAVFIVNVNHLKSKGSACDLPDQGDGQGNCNQVRVNAVNELMNWFATDPTGTGDPDILLVGDYNAYAMEDPIIALENGGFTHLIKTFLGPDAYSYVFDGQWGYLDHALGSASITPQVKGVADYHINADEPSVLDYNTEFKSAGQIVSLYAPDQFRVSDHDPVIIGLTPNAPPTANAGGPYLVNEGYTVTLTATGSDPNGDSLTYAWDLDNNGSYETSGQNVSFSAASLDGPSSYTVKVKATDPLGLPAESSATVNVFNVSPMVTASFSTANVACGANNATLNVSFTDPGAADTHTAVINWGDGSTQTVNPATSPFSLAHTYAAAGIYTATVTVTDDDSDAGATTAAVAVKFNTSGFLQPINADGTSVFKYNSTIPVKISFTDCNGSVPNNLAPTIKLTMLSGITPGLEINEPFSTSAADTTGVMRFSTNQYIYNLATKPLPDSSATYLITVTIPYNGQTFTVQFGLRP
jgi:predicted extracellular nuclease